MTNIDLDKLADLADDDTIKGQVIIEYLRDQLDVGHMTYQLLRFPGVVISIGNYGYSTYPPEWVMNYMVKGYWRIDPASTLAFNRASAFDWDEAAKSPELDQLWLDANDHGISNYGFTIPIHGPNQEASILSVSSKWPISDVAAWRKRQPELIRLLMPITAIFFDRFARQFGVGQYAQPTHALLSYAEREALSWISLGKTAWETSQILGKSQRTIEFQLASCREKLGAVTTAHAITRAVAGGFLEDLGGSHNEAA